MKTPTAMKKLSMATALAAISASAVVISKAEAAIIQVDPGDLSFTGLITFDEVTYTPPNPIPGNIPGNNYDNIFFAQDSTDPSVGVNFAERFVGQTLSYLPPLPPSSGEFDVLSGNPANLLSLEAGAANQNITVWSNDKVLSGLGPSQFPNLDAIGEGAISILFPQNQSEFGFLLQGADTTGQVTLDFFRRNGSLISTTTIDATNPFGYANQYYGFKATDGDEIWGVSITNYDPDGIAIDNIIYDNPGPPAPPPQNVPDPSSVLGLLAIGALGGSLKLKGKLRP